MKQVLCYFTLFLLSTQTFATNMPNLSNKKLKCHGPSISLYINIDTLVFGSESKNQYLASYSFYKSIDHTEFVIIKQYYYTNNYWSLKFNNNPIDFQADMKLNTFSNSFVNSFIKTTDFKENLNCVIFESLEDVIIQ